MTTSAVQPAAGYIGGKRNLARRMTELLESIPHHTYAEPFVGMGGIFLRRRRPSPAEVINDISGDVVTLFRMLQEHPHYFLDLVGSWRLSSRAEFNRLKAIDGAYLTDLQRAVRFLYLQRLAFGGKVSGRNFGVSRGRTSSFNAIKLKRLLAQIHERLADVTLEQLPYGEFIRRYDRADTLFYLDPPYWGCEDDYGPNVFAPADFEAMAEQLAGIAGRFVLSINDTPEIRAIFNRFSIQEVQTTWQIGAKPKAVGELIIQNA